MWTRQEQIATLHHAYRELERAERDLELYLLGRPPAASVALAKRMLAACKEDRLAAFEAIHALQDGGWPILFRRGVIRQIKALAIMSFSFQFLLEQDAAETAAIDAEERRLKNAMSMLDI